MAVDQEKEGEINMAKYSGPKCRLCRREGVKLFLKGSRCYSDKCALSRKAYAPGVHGNRRARSKVSDFGKQLREKQKIKRIYGVLENQFRKYLASATKKKGITGEYLMQTLERRLDNVIYRSNLAVSRNQARQLIRQKKFKINNLIVDIPSYQVSKGDIITTESAHINLSSDMETPVWINLKESKDKKEISILDVPKREDIKEEIEEGLIV